MMKNPSLKPRPNIMRAKGFDARGTVTKAFREVEKVDFQFYLTFVLDGRKVMVKRPANKKEVFQILSSVFRVDRGIFPIS